MFEHCLNFPETNYVSCPPPFAILHPLNSVFINQTKSFCGSSKFSNDNFREISSGVSELWSVIQRNEQIFLYKENDKAFWFYY